MEDEARASPRARRRRRRLPPHLPLLTVHCPRVDWTGGGGGGGGGRGDGENLYEIDHNYYFDIR